jgi:hypothetical protein
MPAHLIDARRVDLLFCSSSNLLTLLNVVQSGRFETDSDPAAQRRISLTIQQTDTAIGTKSDRPSATWSLVYPDLGISDFLGFQINQKRS